jgi:ribosomal protein S17E
VRVVERALSVSSTAVRNRIEGFICSEVLCDNAY